MPLPCEQLRPVQAERLDTDEHPARLRDGYGPFLEKKYIGRSGVFNDDGFHGLGAAGDEACVSKLHGWWTPSG